MAQFIRIPTNEDICQQNNEESSMNFWNDNQQCSQISYRNQRVICIDWHTTRNQVFVQDGDDYFFLTSPTIENLTIRNVLEALGIDHEPIQLDWSEYNANIHNLLDTPVKTAELNQMTILSPDDRITDQPIVHNISVVLE